MKIPIDSIRLDGDTQSRDGVKQDIVNEYADDMREGAVFPPVIVYDDGKSKWLSEGFHRLYAARQAGAQEIEAEVRQGTNAMRSSTPCARTPRTERGAPTPTSAGRWRWPFVGSSRKGGR